MDAPIGTLLAFPPAPGKGAPDNAGGGANSVYSASLARHLLSRGLAVELMFKRVREGGGEGAAIGNCSKNGA